MARKGWSDAARLKSAQVRAARKGLVVGRNVPLAPYRLYRTMAARKITPKLRPVFKKGSRALTPKITYRRVR